MVRSACRRFVLPTPRSRWPIHTSPARGPPESGVAGSIPFINAAERALRGIARGRKSWLFVVPIAAASGQPQCSADRDGEAERVDPRAWLADVLARIADHPVHA